MPLTLIYSNLFRAIKGIPLEKSKTEFPNPVQDKLEVPQKAEAPVEKRSSTPDRLKNIADGDKSAIEKL